MPTSTPLQPVVDALERADALDAVGKTLGGAVRGLVPTGAVKDALSGTWLGHAVHPPLTDLVIGSFLSATLLDLMQRDDAAARRLIGVGIAAAVPTALTGANDWADTEIADPAVRRVGLVHATANVTSLVLFSASLLARRRSGGRGRGRLLALAGTGVMSAGGYLGGHLSYARGIGPNQTAYDPGPDTWTVATNADALRDGEPLGAIAGDTPVLLLRRGSTIHAIHNRCSHRGCMLSEGELDGQVITCACHGSRFDVTDGSVLRGPASSAQPCLEAREANGAIEVRLPARG